jgi:hypothetical protein
MIGDFSGKVNVIEKMKKISSIKKTKEEKFSNAIVQEL